MNPTPRTLPDARGRRLPLRRYERVVSLVPSLTDTVFGLGAGSRLVGRTIYCVEPRREVRSIPACGGTKNPDLRKLQRVRPDLVLACLEENKPEHLAAIENAGVPVFAVMPRRLDDVAVMLQEFGVILQAEAAGGRAMADLTAARLACGDFRRRTQGSGERLTVAVMIWKEPWMAAGGRTHIDAVLQELGFRNVFADRPDYPVTTVEELAGLQPDLVLLPDEPYRFTRHDAWALAAAGVIPDRRAALTLDGKLLSWYGTRTAKSLRRLVKMLERTVGPPSP
ncbi:ABC transporter substrate-binding protein [bacterium]|nr:ABC transporter substrate-binding protein [bacterium]